MKLRPIFVDVLPEFDTIKAGELWISHKYRTVNLRCPCGCGDLTVLALHPSRWHVHFDGKSVSLKGLAGGSVWANSGCGSHYLIRNNAVIWADRSIRVVIRVHRRRTDPACLGLTRAVRAFVHGSGAYGAVCR